MKVMEMNSGLKSESSLSRYNLWIIFEFELICWDPKDGELYSNRMKSEEILMEVRSDCDVQIHRQIWA